MTTLDFSTSADELVFTSPVMCFDLRAALKVIRHRICNALDRVGGAVQQAPVKG